MIAKANSTTPTTAIARGTRSRCSRLTGAASTKLSRMASATGTKISRPRYRAVDDDDGEQGQRDGADQRGDVFGALRFHRPVDHATVCVPS